MNERIDKLIQGYQALAGPRPEWAYPLSPSIPFVGNEYFETSRRMAIYASAENLSHYERGETPIPGYHRDQRVWNRHRAAREESENRFFPSVHIAPVEKGGLLVAALFLRQLLGHAYQPASPSEFLETLCAANVGKYAIRTEGTPHKGYGGNLKYVEPSLPLFEMDLEYLRPDVLMIPKSIFDHPPVAEIIQKTVPSAVVVPAPQFSPQVLNIHLKHRSERASTLSRDLAGSTVESWIDHLEGLKKGNVYRYLAELESIVAG